MGEDICFGIYGKKRVQVNGWNYYFYCENRYKC